MARLLSSVVLGTLLLAGCTVGPDYVPPKAAAPADHFLRAGADAVPAPVAAAWWTELGDPQLSALIEQGLANAPQIAVAEAKVRQARAGLASSRAAMMPAIAASPTYVHADLPQTVLGNSVDLFNIGFDAQWEIDLWGGKRRGVEQSRAQLAAAEAQAADAQVALAAEIARTYVTLRARQQSADLITQRCTIEAQLAELTQQRFAAGTQVRQSVEGARANLERCQGELAGVQADAVALRDALAVLTGQTPGALDGLGAGAIPLPPRAARVGDPAAMLARRPDIRAAERAYAAATAGIGAAEAKRYPTINLLGIVGMGGTNAGDAFDPSSLVTAVAPMLRWNFLNFGRVEAGVQSARAGRDLALAQYQGAVLAALQDAESALGRFGAARTSFATSAAAANHAGEVARLQAMRAQAGTIARGDALEAQRGAINAALAAANDRAALAQSFVALSKALGLGWGAASVKGGG